MPLTQQVFESAVACLTDVYPLWVSQERHDQKRVVNPTGHGSASISIEPYFGIHSLLELHKKLSDRESVADFRKLVDRYNPELNGYLGLPGFMRKIDCLDLLLGWCNYIFDIGRGNVEAARDTIQRFASITNETKIEVCAIVALAGLSLPGEVDELRLNDKTVLRKLSPKEIAEIGSNDIFSESVHDPLGHAVSTCVVQTYHAQAIFAQEALNVDPAPDQNDDIEKLLQAAHIVKSGKAGRFLSFTKYINSPLPVSGTGGSWPIYRPPYPALPLEANDLAPLRDLYQSLDNSRDEITIAAKRLIDAEHRHSPVDALLDTIIGLETLLNPMDASELSFRVALNYAFLAEEEHRRNRYDEIKKVQKIRNQVVHGGLNLQSPQAQQIHDAAKSGKDLLRDSLKRFLCDPSLMGNQKLTVDFWLNRVIPTN